MGKSNCITFSAENANYPFLTENLAMWQFFAPGLKKRFSELDAKASMAQRVLLEMLPSGQSTLDEAAGRLAISKRSLQRRLSHEAANYQNILNATRQELAQHYLSTIRAFSNWTGQTPAQYRRAQAL